MSKNVATSDLDVAVNLIHLSVFGECMDNDEDDDDNVDLNKNKSNMEVD